jgi:hypothetical protein
MTREMQRGNKIIMDSFVCEDFVLPISKTSLPDTEDFFPPINRFSRRRLGHAVLAEWEQVCFKNRLLCVYEED